MLQVKKLSETKTPLVFLFYGKTGTGKTTLAGTFPKPLFLDFNEEGTTSVKDVEGEYISIKNYKEFEEFVSEIDKYEEKLKFQSIIIDTAGKLQDMDLLELSKGGKILINHYGDSTNELQQMFLKLVDYTQNREKQIYLAFNCHERDNTVADESTGEILNPSVGPQLTPKLAEWLQAICTVVGHTRKVEVKDDLGQSKGVFYCLKISADPVFKTKVRIPKDKMTKAGLIANPTCEKLMAVLDGTYEERFMKRKEGK